MMKKRMFLLLVAIIFAMMSTAFAQQEVDEFFRCRVGNISFALPGFPDVFQEPDLPAGDLENSYLAWNNKYQLTGYGPGDGEFQVHIADMTPAIQWMQEERPGEEMYQYQANAVMNLVKVYLNMYDGTIVGEPDLVGIRMEDEVILQISFEYTYPDAVGVPYRGKAYMDGNQAVVMMVLADEENLVYLNDMGPISDEEIAALPAAVPEVVEVGRLQITFPEAPLKDETDGYWLYQAFTDDFGYVSAEHMSADFSFMLEDGMTMKELLPTLAEVSAKGYQAEGTIGDYEIVQLADDLYAFRAFAEDASYPAGYGPRGSYILGVFGPEGVYVVEMTDTEMGRAAYNSLVIADEEK